MTWFKTGWQTLPSSNHRLNPLNIDITCPDRKKFANSTECVLDAVHQITKTHSPPYTLLVSGGTDSQAMLYAWKLSGVPFRAVHYSYCDLNVHDRVTLRQFSARERIPIERANFDALNFIRSEELVEYAKRFDCVSPQLLTYIKMIQQHTETVIMSGNFFNGSDLGINYTLLSLDRYRQSSKTNFVPFFFCSTPSLTYITDYIDSSNGYHDRTDLYKFKNSVYNSFGAQIIPQEKAYTGFELIKDICDDMEVPPSLQVKYKDKDSKRAFDIFYRYELYKHVGIYSTRINIIQRNTHEIYYRL